MRVLHPACAVGIYPDDRGHLLGEDRGKRLCIAESILVGCHDKELAHRSRGHGVRIEIAHDGTGRAVDPRLGEGFRIIADDGRQPKPVKHLSLTDRISRLSQTTNTSAMTLDVSPPRERPMA